jgi:UDP-N-acetylglucosamine 2-epimerase
MGTKLPVVFPVHPRTRKAMDLLDRRITLPERIRLVDPVGYGDMVALQRSAKMILTDSGGIQKEAYWLARPCLTLRHETEWVETVEAGWNRLVGPDTQEIVDAVESFTPPTEHPPLYGDGRAATRCVRAIEDSFAGIY